MTKPVRLGSAALALMIGCTPSVAPPAGGAAPVKDPAVQSPSSSAWYVGLLGERGEPDCPDGKEHWVDVEPTLGGTPTNALSVTELVWLDRPVVAAGHASAPPEGRTVTPLVNPCPPMQMREDWRYTPRGMRILRGGGGGPIPAFFARDSLRLLAELTARHDENGLVIDFRNPVPVELTDVAIHLHYEGCRGKPGTMHREHAVGALGIGAGVQARFDALIDGPDPRGAGGHAAHRAQSVQIIAHGVDVTFDLDVPLVALGAAVQCPDRG